MSRKHATPVKAASSRMNFFGVLALFKKSTDSKSQTARKQYELIKPRPTQLDSELINRSVSSPLNNAFSANLTPTVEVRIESDSEYAVAAIPMNDSAIITAHSEPQSSVSKKEAITRVAAAIADLYHQEHDEIEAFSQYIPASKRLKK